MYQILFSKLSVPFNLETWNFILAKIRLLMYSYYNQNPIKCFCGQKTPRNRLKIKDILQPILLAPVFKIKSQSNVGNSQFLVEAFPKPKKEHTPPLDDQGHQYELSHFLLHF